MERQELSNRELIRHIRRAYASTLSEKLMKRHELTLEERESLAIVEGLDTVGFLLGQLDEAQSQLFSCFNQACAEGIDPIVERMGYHHQYLSAYEHAQDYLIKAGLIDEADCAVKV